MLLAENQWGTTTEQVGVWVGCFCAIVFLVVMVLTGINQANKLFRPIKKRKPADERYVTRAELRASTDPLWRDLRELSKSIAEVTVSAIKQRDDMRTMIDQALEPVEKKLDNLGLLMARITERIKVEVNHHEN